MGKFSKDSGFGVAGILAVVVIVGLLGFSGWLVYDRQKGNDTDSNAESPAIASNNSETSDALVTTTIKTSGTGSFAVSVKHPSTWEVSNTSEDAGYGDGSQRTIAYIKSDKGHYMNIRDVSGVGGSCDPDTQTYTLVKRFNTGVADHYFSEYDSDVLTLEDLSEKTNIKSMKEGDTRTNTCERAGYPFVNGSLYVTISSSASKSLVGDLHYSDIKDDPDFIAMMQSLAVSQK